VIETSRLVLRPWQEADVAEFIRTTNTSRVMEFLGGVQDPDSMLASCARAFACQAANGFCLWIVERRSDRALLGFCGLKRGTVAPIMDEIEIGWRLREDAWGQGFAREGAAASLDWAWRNLSCARVVAMTARGNTRSWGLMERLGMHRQPELDFDHPDFPPGHPARPHIVYTIPRPA